MNQINISPEIRTHLAPHFQQHLLGSKFFCSSPEDLIEKAMRQFPKQFNNAQPDSDGRIRISLLFPEDIGISNVVRISELTQEKISRIEVVDRQRRMVRSVNPTLTPLNNFS